MLKLMALDRIRLGASFCVVLSAVALNMLSTVLLKRVVDVALPQHDARLLGILCSVMLAGVILASLCTVLMARLNHTIGQNLVHRLRKDVFHATQRMPLEHFTSHSVSDVQTRIANDVDGISSVVTFAGQGMVASAASLVTSAVIMLVMSWPIAVVSLSLAAALNILNNRYAQKRRRLTHAQQGKAAEMLHFVGEHLSLSGAVLGRTMGREQWQFDRFSGISREAADTAVQERLAGRTAIATISMTLAVLPILAYWAAGTVLDGISLGSVIVITALQAQISMPIQQLMQLSSDVQSSRALFERIFHVIDLPDAAPCLNQGVRVAREHTSVAEIRLEDAEYGYGGRVGKALKSVNLTLPAGKRIFVTGESGSGKSTLALMMAGLITPQSGRVTARLEGGRTADDMRALVTLVPQESTLFNLSIRENLAFGDPSCSPGRMVGVLRTVELDRLIERLPDGLDTVVGDRGASVSGGERQRLAVARALLADYPVMVFDEFSSGLDKSTSEAVFESLLKRIEGKTLIVVTHRLPTLYGGDIVVTMCAGEVTNVHVQGGAKLHGTPDSVRPLA
ncbi:ABC transporter ATP-binding protein/permease [Streptomyces sp. J2-1]|uniref:ABC transporter ATP-binding protein n=1 Tax=Streptomyces corallincola TaxID=2851888 RepID=UPI001C38E0F0|nr:ABC transporter ATP-binding protein [Streptomyces corallincola]MBV2354688.1 ABC transporter ATP-binding protein/permease [Streptomyces corallincola]